MKSHIGGPGELFIFSWSRQGQMVSKNLAVSCSKDHDLAAMELAEARGGCISSHC